MTVHTTSLPYYLRGEERMCCRKELILSVVQSDLCSLQKEATLFLHAEEMEVLQSYRHDRRRHSFLLGRCAGKEAISSFLGNGASATSFSIRHGLLGEPLIFPPCALISISHTHNIGVALVSDFFIQTGIDIELNINFKQNTAFLPQSNSINKLQSISSWPLETCFGVIWTASESLGKFFKTGLMLPNEHLDECDFLVTRNLITITHLRFQFLKTYVVNLQNMLISITCADKIELQKTEIAKIEDFTRSLSNI